MRMLGHRLVNRRGCGAEFGIGRIEHKQDAPRNFAQQTLNRRIAKQLPSGVVGRGQKHNAHVRVLCRGDDRIDVMGQPCSRHANHVAALRTRA